MSDPARGSTRPERLRRRAEYVAAAKGRRISSRTFSLQGIERRGSDRDLPGPRFGITVTRKIGTATERNRVKRRLRAALRQIAGDPGGSPGPSYFDYVIVARRDVLTAPFQTLTGDIVGAIRGVHRPRGEAKPGRPTPAATD
ncbi:ribonuclease P protein component [Alsobacter sp. R-9]